MESSESDDDSIRAVDDSELFEQYDASLWCDKDCLRPFEDQTGLQGTRLCHACQNLFTGYKEEQIFYNHYYRLSSLQITASRGCRLCTLIRSKVDRETTNHRPSENTRLTFIIYQSSQDHGIISFELWFHYLRVCKRASYGDIVWGIKTIDFVMSDGSNISGFGSHEIALNSQSSENRLLASRWLLNCEVNHRSCNHPRTRQNWMPTRLLDVSSIETTAGTISLVECANIPSDLEYMTLSHCWGSKTIISLTQTNIQNLRSGISVSKLPRTFQDAIIVAGWFRCQYLWIDSLCIIQDSVEDWRKESATMRHVYKNARLNIAATGAADSSLGLFVDREPSLISTGLVSVGWDGKLPKGDFHFYLRRIWEQGINRAPLNRRGWVVQERYLARRNLHFGSESMSFECHELEACETFPAGLPITFHAHVINRFKAVDLPSDQMPTARAISLLESWKKIVVAFMDCDFTYPSDKVVAFSGIAEEFGSRSKDIYLAGLWKNCLFIEQLLWYVNGRNKINGQLSARSLTYRAPSWSWLSINGRINFDIMLQPQPSLVEILEVNVKLADNKYPTGEIRHGIVSLYAHFKCANFGSVAGRRGIFELGDEENNHKGSVALKFDDVAVRPTQSFCLPVIFYRNPSRDILKGLLLAPKGGKAMEFNRVGYFETEDVTAYEWLIRCKNGEKTIFKDIRIVGPKIDEQTLSANNLILIGSEFFDHGHMDLLVDRRSLVVCGRVIELLRART